MRALSSKEQQSVGTGWQRNLLCNGCHGSSNEGNAAISNRVSGTPPLSPCIDEVRHATPTLQGAGLKRMST